MSAANHVTASNETPASSTPSPTPDEVGLSTTTEDADPEPREGSQIRPALDGHPQKTAAFSSQTPHALASAPLGLVGLPAYRFYRSELTLIFARRRNQAGLVGLACVPVIMAVAVKLTDTESGGGFIGSIAGNGMFVVLAALVASLPLFLPVAVAAIAGDSVAGEANAGTLRYLLTVPVGRTKLLAIKFAAIVTFCAACTLVITLSGLMIGWALFPIGDVTLRPVPQFPSLMASAGCCWCALTSQCL